MTSSVPDIPGTKAPLELSLSFRYEVANILGRKQTSFPGAQPISFAAKHLLQLQKEDYYVCEKTDGLRCLMYMTSDGPQEVVYLIDRKNDYYHVPNLHFPLEGDDYSSFHTNTILDGELVNDREPDGTVKMKYMVFDCLVLDGTHLMHRTLDKRLAYFRSKIHVPYERLYTKFPQELEHLPFVIDFKQMHFAYGIEKMFNEILPNLPHGNDGLIFTCVGSPYVHGTDENILKWKPENENSVDFRMHLQFPMIDPDSDDEGQDGSYPDYTAMPRVRLTVSGGDSKGDLPYGDMALATREWEKLKSLEEPLNDRIVECYLETPNVWRFLRFRDDKKESNYVKTVESVMESIQDAVSKEELVRHQDVIKAKWKARLEAKPGAMPAQPRATNVQHGENRNMSSGVKRKFDGADDSNEPGGDQA